MKFITNLFKYSFIALALSAPLKFTQAQEAGVKLDFFGYADNREFTAPHTSPKTIFGTIVSPQLFLKLDDQNKFVGGIHYNQDFGIHNENKNRVNPIAYYNYESKNIDFALGFIPRNEKLDVHRLVLADTFLYDRPNIEGMYFKFRNDNVNQAIYIDWLSKQGYTNKEQFIVGISGHYKWNSFYFKNDGLMYHNALTSNDNLDEHIQDNAVLMARIGLDLTEKTNLDSISMDIGGAVGFDRLRTIYENNMAGLVANIFVGYKKFYVSNTFYKGDALNLPNGDPFYKRDSYNRLDLGWIPFKSKNIDGKFTASFHFTDSGMDNQQAFTLRYRFAESFWKKK